MKSRVSILRFLITPVIAMESVVTLAAGAPGIANPDGDWSSAAVVLAVVVAAGAFGGFVDGLVNDRTYYLRFGNTKTEVGWVGDTLVGVAASIAIFTVASALFGIPFDKIWHTDHFLKMIAIGVISGYAGIRLLNPMSAQMVQNIAREQASRTVSEHYQESTELQLAIADGERLLHDFDVEKDGFQKGGNRKRIDELLDAGEAKFKIALGLSATDPRAMRGLSKTYKRRALWSQDQNQRRQWLEKSIGILSQIISLDPRAALALYNRACYKALMNVKIDDVIVDLKSAIAIHEDLRAYARSDPDFETIQTNQLFIDTLAGR